MTLITRRGLLKPMFAAPAIIAIDRLMPVKLWQPEVYRFRIRNSWGNDWGYDQVTCYGMTFKFARLPPELRRLVYPEHLL